MRTAKQRRSTVLATLVALAVLGTSGCAANLSDAVDNGSSTLDASSATES